MMEQKFFSGVGNYLLAEILYACKILPTRLLKDLSDKDKYNLWFYSKKLLKDSYESGGLTIATYFSMTGEKGIFDHKVYMRKTDPLGNPVFTAVFSNKRTSHYVPAVQK
jgi:formamidopyrimidine-DNA glycosylase